MQSDSVVWDIINHSFCSYKSKVAKERTFCQNEMNVTGLCIRSACPLANSQYATIREENGICYLYQKTAERAHTPKHLWEKIKLPANYAKALEIVSKQLEHYPKYLVHRNKQRLTKIHQMIIRMRKLKLKARPRIETTSSKVDKREDRKERKALKAAQLDQAIEEELLERLKAATASEGIFNYPEKQYTKALSRAHNKYNSTEGLKDVDVDDEEDEDEVEYEYEEEEGFSKEKALNGLATADGGDNEYDVDDYDEDGLNIEYVEDFDESDEEVDVEDMIDTLRDSTVHSQRTGDKRKKKKKKEDVPELEYEYEDEMEPERQKLRMTV
jgi:protein MAK16